MKNEKKSKSKPPREWTEAEHRFFDEVGSDLFPGKEPGDEGVFDEEFSELINECLGNEPPTKKEIAEENRRMKQKQINFKIAGEYIAEAFAEIPFVRKVVLFGDVVIPLKKEIPYFKKFRRARIALWHECSRVEIAVWLDNLNDLKYLQKARVKALNKLHEEKNIGVAHSQGDVYIFEPETDRYRGHLCDFAQCPKGKFQCEVAGCGVVPFLQQYENFSFDFRALDPKKSIVLFERKDST